MEKLLEESLMKFIKMKLMNKKDLKQVIKIHLWINKQLKKNLSRV